MLRTIVLKLINYSCSSYPTRASYSGQVDGFRNPMRTKLKTRPCLKRFQTRMQIFLICIFIRTHNVTFQILLIPLIHHPNNNSLQRHTKFISDLAELVSYNAIFQNFSSSSEFGAQKLFLHIPLVCQLSSHYLVNLFVRYDLASRYRAPDPTTIMCLV